LLVFFLAAYTITQPGTALEQAAMLFPLSSPFAMLARAAMDETLWLHAAALGWQALWVVLIVKGGSLLFRKRVMKSGGAGRAKGPRFARRSAAAEPAE
jgi:ABC-2 type transport system permease protein